MEEYLIFAAIGGLLFLTLFVNSVTEAYEQKQREKRIKILKIKQGLDEFSDLLEELKNCRVGEGLRDAIGKEMMLRLQTIQTLDKNFKGVEALIAEAKNEQDINAQASAPVSIKTEDEYKKQLVKLTRLIRTLKACNWHSDINPEQIKDCIDDIKLLRCETTFQFYSDMASAEFEKDNFMVVKEHYYYIINALKGSTIDTHPRIVELLEQAEFMLEQTNKTIADNAKKMVEQQIQEDHEHEDDNNSTTA